MYWAMTQFDYYKALGLSRTATQAEIKRSYLRLARKVHPDVNQGAREAEDVFKLLGEAYEVLYDSEKRREYDASLQTASRETTPKVDAETKKDLETIAQTLTKVANSPISYSDFFTAYEIWRRLDYTRRSVEVYREKSSHTVAEIEEMQRLKKGFPKDLERLIRLIISNNVLLPEANALFDAYRRAEILSMEYNIDLREQLRTVK